MQFDGLKNVPKYYIFMNFFTNLFYTLLILPQYNTVKPKLMVPAVFLRFRKSFDLEIAKIKKTENPDLNIFRFKKRFSLNVFGVAVSYCIKNAIKIICYD